MSPSNCPTLSPHLAFLYFQQLATVAICKFFVLMTLQQWVGGRGPCIVLATTLQICSFVFNELQDAPPATFFFSCICIVAGGYGVPAKVQTGGMPDKTAGRVPDTVS